MLSQAKDMEFSARNLSQVFSGCSNRTLEKLLGNLSSGWPPPLPPPPLAIYHNLLKAKKVADLSALVASVQF